MGAFRTARHQAGSSAKPRVADRWQVIERLTTVEQAAYNPAYSTAASAWSDATEAGRYP